MKEPLIPGILTQDDFKEWLDHVDPDRLWSPTEVANIIYSSNLEVHNRTIPEEDIEEFRRREMTATFERATNVYPDGQSPARLRPGRQGDDCECPFCHEPGVFKPGNN